MKRIALAALIGASCLSISQAAMSVPKPATNMCLSLGKPIYGNKSTTSLPALTDGDERTSWSAISPFWIAIKVDATNCDADYLMMHYRQSINLSWNDNGRSLDTFDILYSMDSTNGVSGTWKTAASFIRKRADGVVCFSNMKPRWIKVNEKSSGIDTMISRLDIYRSPPPGFANDFWLIFGASIEKMALSSGGNRVHFGDVIHDRYPSYYPMVVHIAQGGERIEDGYVRLTNINLKENSNARYLMHMHGGNNLRDGAWPAGLPDIAESSTNIVRACTNRKILPIQALYTFRNYEWVNYPTLPGGETNGSLLYNERFVDPFIRNLMPYAYDFEINRAMADFYTPTFENYTTLLGGDGVHPTEAGMDYINELWADVADRIVYNPRTVRLSSSTAEPGSILTSKTTNIIFSLSVTTSNANVLSVIMDLSQLGGGISAPMASIGGGTYTYTHSVTAGSVDVGSKRVRANIILDNGDQKSVFYQIQVSDTSPTGFKAQYQGAATNLLTWNPDGIGPYSIYCSMTGPIQDTNKDSSILLAEGMDTSISSFKHVLSQYPETAVTNKTPFWYAISSFDDPGDRGGWFVISKEGYASGSTVSLAYQAAAYPALNVTNSGNKILEMYVREVSPGFDFSQIQVKLMFNWTSLELPIVNYMSDPNPDGWIKVAIPISDYGHSAANLAIGARKVEFKVNLGLADGSRFGVDQIRFTGGQTPFLWYGDDHPQSAAIGGGYHFNNANWTIYQWNETGGASGSLTPILSGINSIINAISNQIPKTINYAPFLTGTSVSPDAGYTNTTFLFKTKYSDVEGDAPLLIGMMVSNADSKVRVGTFPMSGTGSDWQGGVFFTNRMILPTRANYIFQPYAVSINSPGITNRSVFFTGPSVQSYAPIVDAGKDRFLDWPQTSTTITASAWDPDGFITSYCWTEVRNTGISSIRMNTNSPTLSLSGLVRGVYTLKLTVTDNSGRKSEDIVIVSVMEPSGCINIDFGTSIYKSSVSNWNDIVGGNSTIDGILLETLRNTNGKRTPFAIEITNSFRQVGWEAPPPVTSLNIPAPASRDYFMCNTEDPTAGLRISGLDCNKKYSFIFYTSRIKWDTARGNREARHLVRGAPGSTGFADLDCVLNTNNYASVPDIIPTTNGTISIDIMKGPNNAVADDYIHLGVIMMSYKPRSSSVQVQLTSPSNGSTFNSPATIPLRANVTVSNTSVTNVSFYNGSTLLYIDKTFPFEYDWTGVTSGNYPLNVRVITSSNTTASASVSISVVDLSTLSLSFLSPTNNQTIFLSSSIPLTAKASNSSGTIDQVSFFVTDTNHLISTDTSFPHSCIWTNAIAGPQTLIAKAYGSGKVKTTNITVNVVNTNQPIISVVLTKSFPIGNPRPGDTVTYKIDYANNGAQTARGVRLTGLIPEGTSYVPGSLWKEGFGTLTDITNDDSGSFLLKPTFSVESGTAPSQNGILLPGTTGSVSYSVKVSTNAQSSGGSWAIITNTNTGYRFIYIEKDNYAVDNINVTNGGNTTLEIWLKNVSGTINWAAMGISIRNKTPFMNNPITFAPYGVITGNDWARLTIPLSAFTQTGGAMQPFNAVGRIEFRCNSATGKYSFGIDEIRFTGGTTPYIWYGDSHNTNPFTASYSNGFRVLSRPLSGGAGGSVAPTKISNCIITIGSNFPIQNSYYIASVETNPPPAAVPSLIKPFQGATTNSWTTEFTWSDEAANGAIRYWLEIRTNNLFGKVIASNRLLTLSSTGFSGLGSGIYVWRVKASNVNILNWDNWSSERLLTIDRTSPPEVAGLSVSTLPEGNRISLSWTNPSVPDFSKVKIKRKSGIAVSGVTDTSATTIYSNNGQSFLDTGLTDGVLYHYALFTADTLLNWSFGTSSTGVPSDTLAPTNPSLLIINPVNQSNSLRVSWTNPPDSDLSAIWIVRKMGGFPTSRSDGLVKIFGPSVTTFTDTGLLKGTNYYYRLFAGDEVTNWSSGMTNVGIPGDSTPPGPIQNLTTSTNINNAIIISWTNPPDSDFAGIRVIRKTGSAPANMNDGTIILLSNVSVLTDMNLLWGTNYYYDFYTFDQAMNYGLSESISNIRVQDHIAPPEVIGLNVNPTNLVNGLHLGWILPGASDLSKLRLLRKLGSTPITTNDGFLVMTNLVTSVTDLNLNPGSNYFYRLFLADSAGNWNSGTSASGIPSGIPSKSLHLVGTSFPGYEKQYSRLLPITTSATADLFRVKVTNSISHSATNYSTDALSLIMLRSLGTNWITVVMSNIINKKTVSTQTYMIFDDVAPSVQSISVKEGNTVTQKDITIIVDRTGLEDDCIAYLLEETGTLPTLGSAWIMGPIGPETPYNLSAPVGTKNIHLWLVDKSGNISASQSVLVNYSDPFSSIPKNSFIAVKNPIRFSETASMVIHYRVDSGSKATLAIFSIDGSEIIRLKGHEGIIEWNGRNSEGKNVASGIYFALMEVNGKTVTKKPVKLGVLR